jgi:hypothetical protein
MARKTVSPAALGSAELCFTICHATLATLGMAICIQAVFSKK